MGARSKADAGRHYDQNLSHPPCGGGRQSLPHRPGPVRQHPHRPWLAEGRFSPIHIDAVYSSDLYRTCATASAIYLPKSLPLLRRKGLREIHVGAWEQRTWGDIARTDAEQMENFGRHPDLWCVEGAESPRQVLDRAMEALLAIAGENRGKIAAVFSHGYVIRLLLAALQGFSLEQLAEYGGLPAGNR